MSVLHEFTSKKDLSERNLTSSEIFSVFYHDIFEYPLTFSELIKWTSKNPPKIKANIVYKNGFYLVERNNCLVYKREFRKRFSQKKVKIAEKVSKIISLVPTVRMVGISGSLAMKNAERESDIDIIIITKKGRLWTTRMVVYLILKLLGLPLRNPHSLKQKDRLCLNIWLDESDLEWSKKERNFYTAHEVLQIVPLVNKKMAYERFLQENKWAFDYWPNAVDSRLIKNNTLYTKLRNLNPIESLAYKIQHSYMKSKITREVVKPTRAIFHPNNLSKKIIKRMLLTETD